jgi:hypothetical protein
MEHVRFLSGLALSHVIQDTKHILLPTFSEIMDIDRMNAEWKISPTGLPFTREEFNFQIKFKIANKLKDRRDVVEYFFGTTSPKPIQGKNTN